MIANRALEILGEEKGKTGTSARTPMSIWPSPPMTLFLMAVHISLLLSLDRLLQEMEELHKEFLRKAEEFDPLIKMGRTHLQDAVPIRLGQEFAAYACVLARDRERIYRTREGLYAVNMGATAVGTGLNADPEYIEKVVGFLGRLDGASQ